MATVTLTIPNPVAPRVGDAVAARHGYTGFEADGTTPQTKLEFVRKYLMKHLKREVALHEAGTAGHSAFSAAENDVEVNIIIT